MIRNGYYRRRIQLSGEFIEPMLRDDPGRFVLFPIEHKEIWNFYKQHEAAFGPLKKSI